MIFVLSGIFALFYLVCLLINILSIQVCTSATSCEVNVIFVSYISILSPYQPVTYMPLSAPDCFLTRLGLLFMVMLVASSAMMQPDWPSHTVYLPPVFSLYLMEIILSLSLFSVHYCLPMFCMCLCVCCVQFGPSFVPYWYCLYEDVLPITQLSSLFFHIDTTLWSLGCCICALCYM